MAEDIPVTGPGGTPPRTEGNYPVTGAGYARPGYPTFETIAPAAARRVSWGAIFAGAVVAVVIELALNTLGLAILFGSINPATEVQPFRGMGAGTGIWLVVTTLLALFAGGWTAARLAGLPQRADGVLHGVVAWGLVTLFTTWFSFNLVGNVVSGAFGLVGSTLGLVGQGVAAAAPAAAQALGGGESDVGGQIENFLRQTGDPQLRPEALRERAEAAVTEPAPGAPGPTNALDAVQNAFARLAVQGEAVVNEVDRQDAINVLTARTDLSRAEATRVVDNWIQNWNQFRANLPTTQQVGETAAQVTEDVSGAIGSFLLWSFVAMALGVIASAIGGSLGGPREIPVPVATTGAGVTREH